MPKAWGFLTRIPKKAKGVEISPATFITDLCWLVHSGPACNGIGIFLTAKEAMRSHWPQWKKTNAKGGRTRRYAKNSGVGNLFIADPSDWRFGTYANNQKFSNIHD